jgi:hypothetical protein
MTPKEKELVQGMCNCYSSCGDNFENTVWMVARARGLSSEKVMATLSEVSGRCSNDDDYRELRRRLPAEFPF